MGTVRIVVALGLLCAMAMSAAARAECRIIKQGTLPVRLFGNQIMLAGKLNGRDMNILMDTGAEESVIGKEAAEAAGVTLATGTAQVEALQIGDYVVSDRSWPAVSGLLDGEAGMILGMDFWSKVDFEIDLANSEIILWDPKDCLGATLARWSKDPMVAKLKMPVRGKFETEAVVNGKPVTAMIDTGASTTSINSTIARSVGFSVSEEDKDSQGADNFIATFDTFQMGEYGIKNARIAAFDFANQKRFGEPLVNPVDLVIGTDFLLANHVLVSQSQGRIYMTWNGGTVFQTRLPEVEAHEAECQAPVGQSCEPPAPAAQEAPN